MVIILLAPEVVFLLHYGSLHPFLSGSTAKSRTQTLGICNKAEGTLFI